MSQEFIITLGNQVIQTILLLSAPMLVAGLAIGLLIGILQAVTQIHEMTLTFVPKIIAVFVALIFAFPWLMKIILSFTTNLFQNIPKLIQ